MSDGDYLRGWQDCARQVSDEQDDLAERAEREVVRAERLLDREERRRTPGYGTVFGRRIPFLPFYLALAPAYFALGLGAGDRLQAVLSGALAALFATSAPDDLAKRRRRRRTARRAEGEA